MLKTQIIGILLLTSMLTLGACAPAPQPTPAPTPAPEPSPLPEPLPELSLSEVGEMVDIGNGAAIMVESFERQGNLGYINVLIDNSEGSEDIRVDFQMSFSVEDNEGNIAQLNISTEGDYPLPQGNVPAGDQLRGTLVYQMAHLGEGLSLYYSHDISQVYVKIAL